MIFRSTLSVAVLLGAFHAPIAAQQGTVSIGPDWSPEPKSYTTTAALFADSIFASWDGEQKITLRVRVLEIVGREAERYIAGGEHEMEPGSGPFRLNDLLPAGMLGGGAPVVRWTNEVYSVPGSFLGPTGWKPEHLEALTKDFPVDWATEALLVIGLTAVTDGDLDSVNVVPLLVVRPYVPDPADSR